MLRSAVAEMFLFLLLWNTPLKVQMTERIVNYLKYTKIRVNLKLVIV